MSKSKNVCPVVDDAVLSVHVSLWKFEMKMDGCRRAGLGEADLLLCRVGRKSG